MNDRPNILWIQCDELRADALECYGNRYGEMQTPHIDSIAEQGTLFANCFCNSPVCVASRTSMLTGQHARDTGVYHNEGVWPHFQMPDPPLTFPQVFAQQGYRTANFGKTHVHQNLTVWQESNTDGAGMAEFFETVSRDDPDLITRLSTPVVIGGRFPGDVPYPGATVTDNTLNWLDATPDDQPFLLRVSYLQPHTPVLPPPPYDQLYNQVNFPREASGNPQGSVYEQQFARHARAHELSEDEMFRVQSEYYGLVAWVDTQVGRILDFLRQRDLTQRTIVIFDADHGTSLGDGGRFQKQSFAPESHRIPRLISWPGTLPAGRNDEAICEGLDLARTLFALAGVTAPEQFKGRDVLSDPAPEAVYATLGYGFADSRCYANLGVGEYVDGHGWPRRACVRTQRYRLDKNVRLDGEPVSNDHADLFLADMRDDPWETRNLASDPAHVEIADQLSRQIDEHLRDAVEVPQAYVQRRPAIGL